jgi:ABC-type polysaccharide/polyol phosphate transport system ATPase subunit
LSTAIQFDNVSKVYQLEQDRDNLRETLSNLPHRLLGHRARPEARLLSALHEVSFQLSPGRILGIVGPNGSGKSTILKLAAGITQPTAGCVDVHGRVGSLIELGAGFHPDLTGRENVFLNGQIMGMSRRQIAARYADIVDFAELSGFMNMPVKRYSSGMYARLGFAVAAHLDPDVLLVDEVLSVGDASFQRKSIERMVALLNRGQAVLFVSHNLLAVEQMCDRVLWLDQGRVRGVGKTREVLRAYLTSEEARFVRHSPALGLNGTGLVIEQVRLINESSSATTEFPSGQDIHIEIQYRATERLNGLRFALGVTNARGPLFCANMLIDGHAVSSSPGVGTLQCCFNSAPLNPGAYQVFGEVWGAQGYHVIVPWSEWARFRVTAVNPGAPALSDEYSVFHVHADAPISVGYSWRGCDEEDGKVGHA